MEQAKKLKNDDAILVGYNNIYGEDHKFIHTSSAHALFAQGALCLVDLLVAGSHPSHCILLSPWTRHFATRLFRQQGYQGLFCRQRIGRRR
jgi:hypothetical protein